MPYILLFADIRQGVFYATLLSFWLVFAGEHMLIQESAGQSSLKSYWRHLSAVATGCLSLFVFDVCERGAQLRNPFGTIWVSKLGSNILVSLILNVNTTGMNFHLFSCFYFSLHSSYWQQFQHAFTLYSCVIWFGVFSVTSVLNVRRCHQCRWHDAYTMKESSIVLNFSCWQH